MKKNIKNYQTIAILGGHKLALSYYRKLMEAKKTGVLKVDQIIAVSADANAPILSDISTEDFICKTPAEFIARDLCEWNEDIENCALVPDHTSRHVMLEAFMAWLKIHAPQKKVTLEPLNMPLDFPFTYKSENNAIIAMSYATWACPPDCDEPAICPHIQNKREWDFNKIFTEENWKTFSSSHLYPFACEPLHAEISQIPFAKIQTQFKKLFKKLKEKLNSAQPHAIATHSHCHGIVGQLKVGE